MNQVGIHALAMNCALGSGLNTIWQNALSGHSPGMKPSDRYVPTILGQVEFQKQNLQPAFDCRINHMLIQAFQQLKGDFERLTQSTKATRIGVVLGTSTSAVDELEAAIKRLDSNHEWPQRYQAHMQRMACVSECLADYLSISGPTLSISTACSSSAKAIITAKNWLNQGLCDVVIAGGVDVICELTVKGFHALGALSDDLTNPFSINRKGINIGEGVSLMLLSNEPAQVNVVGTGISADAHHISAPDPSGKGAISAMSCALTEAGIEPEDIDYINLHGTGTPQNDAMESLAVQSLFGSSTPCSSSKTLMGHTLGAAGALELGLTALSMSTSNQTGQYLPHFYDQQADPKLSTLNLVQVNNDLGRPKLALSNSFAFGGNNAAVVLGRSDVPNR